MGRLDCDCRWKASMTRLPTAQKARPCSERLWLSAPLAFLGVLNFLTTVDPAIETSVTMEPNDPYSYYLPYEQYANNNVDDYILNAGYQDDQVDYELSRPHRPDTLTRQSQAAFGRARLSLPPPAPVPIEVNDYLGYNYASTPSDDYTRAYLENQSEDIRPSIQAVHALAPTESRPYQHIFRRQESSSSPTNAVPSSPTYQASQRQQNPEASMPIRSYAFPTAQQRKPEIDRGPPTVQGIQLVPVHTLPDRFRTIFPFAMFNAVQSACFQSIYESDDNCVFSSPTGSGKTVLFEIAICRMLRGWTNGTFKVVYMAPTKSLCSERARDWKAKFGPLNLKCEEMTGDSDITSLHHVQRADIIVTTPEKWDSMTRKWKDHEKLVRLIKLLLIDEVHILNKDRGAALEVVVSRMKSVGAGTRFVALSATVPNSQDIATWLGRNDDTPNVPATHKRFGEEFRPVELTRYVCGYQSNANAFGFDTVLTKNRLSDVVVKYSQKKPIMVFCFTRKSCSEAAKFLAEWWKHSAPKNRYWHAPTRQIRVEDKGLQSTVSAGVAVHHAGLGLDDRGAVESAYLAGELSVICCTSTLAVGVNLPCHMVIIKNTVSYEAGAIKEYSDLEIMQMIGRAGRPQFDTSALAVIMTKMQQVKHYEQLLSGQERLESCLHLNLVEHLNAEIGLGMVPDLCAAKKWLAGTFLRVRLEDNPTHYQIKGDTPDRDLGARLEQICDSAISQLQELGLIECTPSFKTTDYGEAMARYYMNITTMETILSLPRKPKISEILAVISQAHEFRELRFRSGEKPVYKELNDMPDIRFPIKVDLSAYAHKVSLIVQSVLGGVRHVADQSNHRVQNSIDQTLIFQHIHRLIRCIVDCQSFDKDAIGIRNALMLSRSLAARVWDDSPMVLQQIEQIGPVALRKLVGAKITTMDEFASTEPGRLEYVLNKAPPFGLNMHNRIQAFPKLRVALQMIGQPFVKAQEHVAVKLKIDLGFLNQKTPVYYRTKPVFVIVLKLERINPINATAYLTSPTQLIECYWDDGGLNDDDFIRAEPKEDDFMDVDALDQTISAPPNIGKTKSRNITVNTAQAPQEQRLENGNFACAHTCKDKKACKHRCCKVGMEKKPRPKPPKPKDSETRSIASKSNNTSESSMKMQTKLDLPIRKKGGEPVEHLDLSQTKESRKTRVPVAASRLASLHDKTTRSSEIPILGTAPAIRTTPVSGGYTRPRFIRTLSPVNPIDEIFDEPERIEPFETHEDHNEELLTDDEEYLDRDEEMLDAALVGLEDSQSLQNSDEVVEPTERQESQGMLDSQTDHPEEEDGQPELFMTPHPARVNVLPEEFEDAVAMFSQSSDDRYAASLDTSVVKRKRDEGVPSAYFSAKKVRIASHEAAQSPKEQEDEVSGQSEERKKEREVEELRAWLAAEFGDTVEMV
ncbi:P-loop containing nucleoside triphosphate hydrolase protein [Aureobasidium pullulans]|nr:P-loop containing nucleoside triphosphate hydrolase protein [Aureobasidium pullulans]